MIYSFFRGFFFNILIQILKVADTRINRSPPLFEDCRKLLFFFYEFYMSALYQTS